MERLSIGSGIAVAAIAMAFAIAIASACMMDSHIDPARAEAAKRDAIRSELRYQLEQKIITPEQYGVKMDEFIQQVMKNK